MSEKEPEDFKGESMSAAKHSLRITLAACGVLGVVILFALPDRNEVRIAAAAISILSIVTLSWNLRRKAGSASRESEILAERLVKGVDRMRGELEVEKRERQLLERYFEALMEHIPSNLYFKDLESRFLRVNQKMAERFGCEDPHDLIGKTDHDIFGPHADDALRDEKEILRTGKGIIGKVEHEEFPETGKEGWVLTTKMPFREHSGKIIGTFGMSSDVTELMQTRVALEKERNMLRSLIDSFPDRIFVRDPERRYLMVNKAMADWAGETPEGMLGRTPADFFPAEVIQRGVEEDRKLFAEGEPVINSEWSSRGPDGEEREFLTTKVPLLDADGKPWGLVGMDRDVTESKRATRRAQLSQQRLQEMMDNSPAVIYLKDLEGRYQMVNRGFEEMFGLERADVMGRTDHDILSDKEAAAAFHERDVEVVKSGEPMPLDERFYVDGNRRWYSTVRFPLRDAAGQIHAVAGISTDVTDRREAEDEMKKLNADLVRANDDLQRAHEQLIQAEKLESVGRLAAGVAHEVKNPLAMIGMGLELLARRIPEDDQSGLETIERMKRGIERANRIVKGLVDFSSARQFSREAVDPNRIVREAHALVDYQLRKAGVKVVEELTTELPEVEIDQTKIEQVLVNLMINAMQAMGEGGGTITLRTYATKLADVKRDEGMRTSKHLRLNDRVVCIEIDDTGPGIDQENLARVYDPFFTTKPTGQGTGLGLSVSRKIIELHHGRLELENRPDTRGARARITLNANIPSPAATQPFA